MSNNNILQKSNITTQIFKVVICFLCMIGLSLKAQFVERKIITTAGAYAGFPDLQVQWSLGTIVGDPTAVNGTHFSQGFQQPTCISSPAVLINAGNHQITKCVGASINLSAAGGDAYSWSDGQTTAIISITQPGIYWLQGIDREGCKARDSILVVESIPQVQINNNTNILPKCPGSVLSLFAGGASTYLWSNSQTQDTVLISQPGWYWVEGRDSIGCVVRDSILVVEDTSLNPAISFTPSLPPNLCYYESPLLLNFAQPSGGQWSGSGIILQNQQPYFAPAFATVGANVLYYLYTDPVLGCVGVDSIAFTVNACTGLESDQALPDLHLYPVPADLYLEVSGYMLPERVEVINISGQRLLLPTLNNRIQTETLPNGVYYLSLPESVLPFTVLHP